jgi:hypothetical protein
LSSHQKEHLRDVVDQLTQAVRTLSGFAGDDAAFPEAPATNTWPQAPPSLDPIAISTVAHRRDEFMEAALAPLLDSDVPWHTARVALEQSTERSAQVALVDRIVDLRGKHRTVTTLELFFPLLAVYPLSVLARSLLAPEVAGQVTVDWDGTGVPPREAIIYLDNMG